MPDIDVECTGTCITTSLNLGATMIGYIMIELSLNLSHADRFPF